MADNILKCVEDEKKVLMRYLGKLEDMGDQSGELNNMKKVVQSRMTELENIEFELLEQQIETEELNQKQQRHQSPLPLLKENANVKDIIATASLKISPTNTDSSSSPISALESTASESKSHFAEDGSVSSEITGLYTAGSSSSGCGSISAGATATATPCRGQNGCDTANCTPKPSMYIQELHCNINMNIPFNLLSNDLTAVGADRRDSQTFSRSQSYRRYRSNSDEIKIQSAKRFSGNDYPLKSVNHYQKNSQQLQLQPSQPPPKYNYYPPAQATSTAEQSNYKDVNISSYQRSSDIAPLIMYNNIYSPTAANYSAKDYDGQRPLSNAPDSSTDSYICSTDMNCSFNSSCNNRQSGSYCSTSSPFQRYQKSTSSVRSRSGNNKKAARPLTKYLPNPNDPRFNLRSYIESNGHNLALVEPLVLLTAVSCYGSLHKSSGIAPFKMWKKRSFIFDRNRRVFAYYASSTSRKLKGQILFDQIIDVYSVTPNSVANNQSSQSSSHSQHIFAVRLLDLWNSDNATNNNKRYKFKEEVRFCAPSLEAKRIWLDVLFTGAEAYMKTLNATRQRMVSNGDDNGLF